jgi:hypothetical protein
MLDALEDPEFADRHSSKPIPLLRRSRASKWVEPDPARNAEADMLGGEVLPAFTFPQQLPKHVVPNPSIAAGGPDSSLLNCLGGGSRNVRVHRSRASKSSIERASEGSDDAAVAGAARLAS